MSNKQIYVPITAGAQQYKQEWDEAIKTTNSAKDAIVNAAVGASQAAQKQAGAVNTLTKEYRASFAEAQKLTQMGESHQAAYIQAAKAAGQYKNDLDDTREVIKAFSSDTPVLTASLGVMQGLAGAASAAAGAMGLMGVEGKQVQEMMLKVQSAMALLQGLQAVGTLYDSFKALKVVILADVIPAIASMNLAMSASIIGVAIVALVALVGWWNQTAKETELAKIAAFDYAATLKAVQEKQRQNIDAQVRNQELYIRSLEDGKQKEIAMNELAMQKELRDNLRMYQDKKIQLSQFEQARLLIAEYYAQERKKIEKKYTPEKEKIEVNVERVTSLKESKVTMTLKPEAKIDTSRIKPVDLSNIFRTKKMDSEFSQQLKNLGTAFSDFGQQLQQSAANIGGGIGYALGAALAGQGNFGDAMKQQLAQLMQQVGTAMIAMGIAYKTTGIGFGYGAMLVGAGIVLNIAAGALAATTGGGGGGGGGGAGSGGGGNMGSGFFGASLQPAVNQQPNLGSKIRGRDLYIVQGRNNRAANRFGGM